MGSLYNHLSAIYEAMYQTFINYDEEFAFYSALLNRDNCDNVLEIGCGTGHLSAKFSAAGFSYTGMDVSEEMLGIAQINYPGENFIKADMRNFVFTGINAVIITGRTISYLITNTDVTQTLNAVYTNLLPGGIICFDCIDALKFIPQIKNGKTVTHHVAKDDDYYLRNSYWEVNYAQSWTFNWHSEYFKKDENNVPQKIGEDDSTIRCFTKDEIKLFIELTGFEIKEIIDRPSYAFDTFVVVAQKP